VLAEINCGRDVFIHLHVSNKIVLLDLLIEEQCLDEKKQDAFKEIHHLETSRCSTAAKAVGHSSQTISNSWTSTQPFPHISTN
jgi:hypothetical protein